jgi:hypothetical protein
VGQCYTDIGDGLPSAAALEGTLGSLARGEPGVL